MQRILEFLATFDMFAGRIYAISDLHVDQDANLAWVQQLSDHQYLNDTIIIAGDVTHDVSKLTQTLKLFRSKFKDVYYCPGNHELWVQQWSEDKDLKIHNSIEKFHYIVDVCDKIGVHTKPGITSAGVTIVPLYGWYDDSLYIPISGISSDLALWTDYHLCKWTDDVPQCDAAKYFVKLNEQHITELIKNGQSSKIVTFSHFLTSKTLMQAYRTEISRRRQKCQATLKDTRSSGQTESGAMTANFSLVAGTELLGEQLKLIKPQVHVFGHSHRKMVLDIGDGISYVNNPLGYIRERESGLIETPVALFEINL